MSEQGSPTSGLLGGNQLRARLNRLRSPHQPGILGPAEIIGLAVSLLILILVIVSYFYFLLPARSHLEILQAERSGIQSKLRRSQDVVRQGQTTDATVQSITQSLDTFENSRLIDANAGRMSLYESLNQLIRKNGLRNTSGPTYAPLEPKGAKNGTTGSKSVNTKWQSIYPGIAISLTVEGQYQNLRRFVRDIETSKQFLIINSVELERSTETDASVPITGDQGSSRGSLVSLRMEMATYFQRSASTGTGTEAIAH